MNKGGIVLVIAGVLVLCQVLGGNALQRLGVVGNHEDQEIDLGPGTFTPHHGGTKGP